MRKKRSKQFDAKAPGKKILEDFQNLSQKILYYGYSDDLRTDFLADVFKTLLAFFGCDAVELHLISNKKIFHYEGTRFPETFITHKISVITNDRNLSAAKKFSNNAAIDLLCRNMLKGDFDLQSPFFTSGGSFWIDDTENPVVIPMSNIKNLPAEKILIGGEYKSRAIIPVMIPDEIIGLLQLKSKKPKRCKKDEVEFCEGIAQILGITFMNRRSQSALRERVKELSCLYNIANVADQPDLSIDNILEIIVSTLPFAWQHPDITSAKITIDSKSYEFPDFEKAVAKQSANILVRGKCRGKVEVVYTKEMPELDEGPFLKEERNLLDTIAMQVALIIQRREVESEKYTLKEQLRHADRLATIGQLAAGVAHELNEPLGNMLGFAQLIKKDENLPGQIHKDLDKIIHASLHAREVIKKLMIFARQVPSKKTKVNLNSVVDEGLYFFESRCAKSAIELVRSLDPNMTFLDADRTQLSQVLINLVVNSIQAMPEGGVLTVRTKVVGDHVLLSVKDTGIGMTEEVRKQVFVPFFTTKDVDQGTGLGLSVVHGIVVSHKGTIEVKSKVGKGTLFEIRLPLFDTQNTEGTNSDGTKS